MNSTSDLEHQSARALKPYPAYKDSGVEWLGEVPAHWEVRAAKWYFREADDRSDTGSEELLSVSHITGVTLRSQKNVTMFRAESNIGHKLCIPGDIVVNTMWAWMGALGIARQTGIVSPSYAVYRPHRSSRLHGEYADLLLRTRAYKNEYVCRSTGIRSSRLRLYPEQFLRIALLCPPPEEQAAIVRFLDHADRCIRRFVRAKQKLIALLEEQKQVIIHQAVTGQMDVGTGQPYPAYKDSGVEWLGNVPTHWELRRLKWVTRLQRGYDLPADRRVPGPFPVVSSGGVIDTHSEWRCAGPGVAMGRYGSTEAVFYIEQDFWPHNTSLFVTSFQGNAQKWCYHLLSTITKADQTDKSAVPGLDRKDLFQIVVPVPPLAEQLEVAGSIEATMRNLTDAISSAKQEIDRVREYRTRLIADVVTGKLDVREAAAGLPDEDLLAGDHAVDGGHETAHVSNSEREVGATGSEEVENPIGDGRDGVGGQEVLA